MGNCCDSNDIDDTAGRTGVPNEDVYVDAPFGTGGGTLSADVDPVAVDKDPVGYMSGDYLSTVASIGKGAYLLYDTLQAGKFEIHYRTSPPPQTAIEQKIVAFGEFIEGETNIADRRFRRNESEVTKTQVTQNAQYVYLAIAEFVLLCFRKKMRLKLVMDGEGLPKNYKLYFHMSGSELRPVSTDEPGLNVHELDFSHIVVLPFKHHVTDDSMSFTHMDLRNRVQRAGGVYQPIEAE